MLVWIIEYIFISLKYICIYKIPYQKELGKSKKMQALLKDSGDFVISLMLGIDFLWKFHLLYDRYKDNFMIYFNRN